MFENSQMWISALASEEIKNQTICIYDHNTKTVRNTKCRDDIAFNVFVFVDEVRNTISTPRSHGEIVVPDIIKQGEWARCLRLNISI